jgi:hypothetical protein
MTDDPVFYTRTMARVYATQQNWDRAIRIYQHLLSQEPGDAELIEELAAVRDAAAAAPTEDLSALLSEWVDLLATLRRIRSLRSVQRGIDKGLSRG